MEVISVNSLLSKRTLPIVIILLENYTPEILAVVLLCYNGKILNISSELSYFREDGHYSSTLK